MKADDKSKMLPVLVYVHGGYLTEGTGPVDGLHETSRMVHLSIQEATPVILVSIGYRLNWLGFMACQDLLDESQASAKDPQEGPFNLGFRDLQKAFLCVRNHIAGFRGDPNNITAFGESEGALSLISQMASSMPLFKRVILQSAATLGTAILKQKDAEYQRLLSAFNIHGETAKGRFEALRQAPINDLVYFAQVLVGAQ